jgi:hypothetical protein
VQQQVAANWGEGVQLNAALREGSYAGITGTVQEQAAKQAAAAEKAAAVFGQCQRGSCAGTAGRPKHEQAAAVSRM